jgi:hypothetical protein
MRLLLSNNKHVGTKIGWKHGTNSNQLYRTEASLTGGKASPADRMLLSGSHRSRTPSAKAMARKYLTGHIDLVVFSSQSSMMGLYIVS